MTEWISVKDKLPKAHQAVLTFSDTGDIIIGRRFFGKKWHFPYFEQDYPILKVTHWMPLPKPPRRLYD